MEKVIIEKFREYEIYFDKQTERFKADNDKLDVHFESRSLWEIKGDIQRSMTENVDKEYIIKSGYFGEELAKIHLLTKNKETKRCKYKIIETTGKGYDDGRIQDDHDMPKLYSLNQKNLTAYTELEVLEKEIKEIKRKQKEIVSQLK